MEMFHQDDEEVSMSSLALEDSEESDDRTGTLKYDEVVKDMILEETQYIRDLNLIIKVFRRLFTREPILFTEEVSAKFWNGKVRSSFEEQVAFDVSLRCEQQAECCNNEHH